MLDVSLIQALEHMKTMLKETEFLECILGDSVNGMCNVHIRHANIETIIYIYIYISLF